MKNYLVGGPGPPSSPSSPDPSPATASVLVASSGGTRLLPIHPTLVLPRNVNTAFVDFSFHNHLPDGALGCFQL